MITRVAIAGASGRMGQLAQAIVAELPEFEVCAKLGSQSALSDMRDADLIIDVTSPAASPEIVEYAVRNGIKVLVGTSGWSSEKIATLRTLLSEHKDAGIILIPNFSIGSVLGSALSTIAGQFFDSIEIIEAHHAAKIDSPSGTAVRTAEMITAARKTQGPVRAPHVDQAARGEQVASIPVHSLRLSGVLAKQEVIFGGVGEVLTITHDTLSPSAYESGMRVSIQAARDARGLTVGLDSVLNLDVLTGMSGARGGHESSETER
ncbi:4-hydroxy-tetrahydrodipicolinate reductase [Lysinibacter sp. HNR]|uniref:4-hydroxy-tetrahydrodipicolinate reductase n=1 Tax=Lysinibacter sp. HNR TaxID=3031408 RepID=UPI002434F946|nr:4-hydroxy-tetrahydrodipicolinate reductase [Lysinibacter sp. HNR]WGD38260.1 4-hydroxy-tetrahydrodipicolinate reductase [Lysinibacter sp. HNR]